MPISFKPSDIGKAPLISFSFPSNDNSPEIANSDRLSWVTPPIAQTIERAIGRSKLEPTFLILAGARLTVIFPFGNRYPEFFIANFILLLDSFMAASGSPMILNAGSPFAMSTSISTLQASMPMTAHEIAFETIFSSLISRLVAKCVLEMFDFLNLFVKWIKFYGNYINMPGDIYNISHF